MSENVIEINHLVKKFKSKIVLNDLTLNIPYNRITTIYGPSGCGKSTLLNIVGALDKFNSGSVKLFGTHVPKVGTKKARQLQRTEMSYLFQNFALISDMSIDQNLNLVHFDHSVSKSEFQSQKNDLLKMMAIDVSTKTKISQLSGGEQQRIALIRALLKPGKLLLCDEPTGSLDPVNRDSLFKALKTAKSMGKSIVIVSHDPEIIGKSDSTFNLGALMSKNTN